MTTYKLHFPDGYDHVVTCHDTIVQAPPAFNLFLGQPWSALLPVLEMTGIRIDPLINTTKSDWVEIEDSQYELRWNDDRTFYKRITKHHNGKSTDIKYSSLPTILRKALE